MVHGRARRRDSGQALAEYAILLALMNGVSLVGHLTDTIHSIGPFTLLAAGAAVVVVGYAFRR